MPVCPSIVHDIAFIVPLPLFTATEWDPDETVSEWPLPTVLDCLPPTVTVTVSTEVCPVAVVICSWPQAVVATAVVVETSTNLVSWQPVITNSLVNGTNAFRDSSWTNYLKRFYRVRSQ